MSNEMNVIERPSKLDQMAGKIYWNGRLVPLADVGISPANRSIFYGLKSIFEGEIFVRGATQTFESRAHSERFLRSAEYAGIKTEITVDDIEAAKKAVLEANTFETGGYVRAWMSADEGISVSVAPESEVIHFGVMAAAITKYWSEDIYKNGITLGTVEQRRIPPRFSRQDVKIGTNYASSERAARQAKALGFNDALMQDEEGFIAEASVANVFLVKGGKIYTPYADPDGQARMLPGITRGTNINVARQNGFEVIDDQRITMEFAMGADEAFTTGSATGITPISRIDDRAFVLTDITDPNVSPDFKVAGPVTQELMRHYAAHLQAHAG